jgi:hypothetical protein
LVPEIANRRSTRVASNGLRLGNWLTAQ